jgi:TM2 domain-containing membrane protein YozV
MALMVCPECQKEVSDKAAACPACGYPIHGIGETESPPQSRPELITVRKSRGVYVILGILLGLTGAHNFYAGYYWQGALQFILGVLLFVTIIGPIIVVFWILYDVIFKRFDADGNMMS